MDPQQILRYDRQIKLSQIGEEGQRKITQSSALIIGMGGLGSPAAMYLAAAGIGKLTISDYDVVEESNLQRQIIHRNHQLGVMKTHSAQQTLAELNPHCQVATVDHELDEQEMRDYIKQSDIVLDCSDNFETRFRVNRLCVDTQTPLVSAAAIRLEGQIMSYLPESNCPCYQCLYNEQYENVQTCEMEGVLGPVVGVLGTMQALVSLLILTGHTQEIKGKLWLFDGLNVSWQQVQLPKNPQCPVCANR